MTGASAPGTMVAEGALLLDASVWIASRDPDDRFQVPALELTFSTDVRDLVLTGLAITPDAAV